MHLALRQVLACSVADWVTLVTVMILEGCMCSMYKCYQELSCLCCLVGASCPVAAVIVLQSRLDLHTLVESRGGQPN